jgi:hypothetical protein
VIGLLLMALLAPCRVTRAVDNTWFGPDLGSWNVGVNWSATVPPDAAVNEAAVIDNGTTAVLSAHTKSEPSPGSGLVDVDVAGVRLGTTTGRFGGLLIVSGGHLPSVPAVGETGTIAVGIAGQGHLAVVGNGIISGPSLTLGGASGSSILLADTASLTVTGAADLQRTTTITGPNVNFSAGDDLTLGSASLLIGEILHASLHSPLKSGGTATLDGTFRPTFGGVTPAHGDTWDIIDADSIVGAFASLDTSAAPALPPGQTYRLIEAIGGVNGRLLQLAVTANCDFSGDALCSLSDLNALLSHGPIAAGVVVVPGVNDQFDLTGDGVIDNADVDQWLASAASLNGLGSSYKRGDANLDGTVDGSDFGLWNSHKFTSTLLWDRGNFNGDAVTDGGDFGLWNMHKFTSSDGASSVPEPAFSSLALSFTLLAMLFRDV